MGLKKYFAVIPGLILLIYLLSLILKQFDLSAATIFDGIVSQNKYTNGPQCKFKKSGGQPKPYCGDLVTMAAVNIREATLETVTTKIRFPWAFEFISEKKILLTEFGGQVKIIDVDDGSVVNVEGAPDLISGKGHLGLLDVALDPEFDDNHLVYFSYTTRKKDQQELYALAVARAELAGNKLLDIREIFVALPFYHTAANFGGALLFDNQGYLLVGSGDRGDSPDKAQDPGDLRGKIIRLGSDGSIPPSNPFYQNKKYHPAVYALGVRNPQGMARDPENGVIYETEHGPMGGDEVNVLEAGKNYGWPTVTYGMNYDYKKIGVGTSARGLKQPIYYYLPSMATSPVEVYRGRMFSEWDGDLLVGALRGTPISKLDVVNGRVLSDSRILNEAGARVRDIKVARDGSIYFALEEGKLYRLSRDNDSVVTPDAAGNRNGEQVYALSCRSCHGVATPGIPKLGSKPDWEKRVTKGRKQLYENAINGFNGMPERGLCSDCSDKEIRDAVDYMLATLR